MYRELGTQAQYILLAEMDVDNAPRKASSVSKLRIEVPSSSLGKALNARAGGTNNETFGRGYFHKPSASPSPMIHSAERSPFPGSNPVCTPGGGTHSRAFFFRAQLNNAVRINPLGRKFSLRNTNNPVVSSQEDNLLKAKLLGAIQNLEDDIGAGEADIRQLQAQIDAAERELETQQQQQQQQQQQTSSSSSTATAADGQSSSLDSSVTDEHNYERFENQEFGSVAERIIVENRVQSLRSRRELDALGTVAQWRKQWLLKEHGVSTMEKYTRKFSKDNNETTAIADAKVAHSPTAADENENPSPSKKRRILIPSVLAEFPEPMYTSPKDCDVFQRNRRQHLMNSSMLQLTMQQRHLANVNRCRYLAVQYARLGEQWVNHQVNALNRREYKEALKLRAQLRASKKASGGAFPSRRESMTAVASPYARDANHARSDADFEAILRQLKEEEAHKKRWTMNKCGVPSMIISERDRKFSFFDNQNGWVEDPKEAERLRKAANPWTEEEKKIFLNKFNKNPKKFYKISSFLPRKSVHDVIEYYYDNALTLDLKRTKPEKKATTGGRLTIGGSMREDQTVVSESASRGGNAQWIWSEREKELFLEAVAEHGKDFAAISKRVGSKSQDKCKNFFNNNKRKYSLDELSGDARGASRRPPKKKKRLGEEDEGAAAGRRKRKRRTKAQVEAERQAQIRDQGLVRQRGEARHGAYEMEQQQLEQQLLLQSQHQQLQNHLLSQLSNSPQMGQQDLQRLAQPIMMNPAFYGFFSPEQQHHQQLQQQLAVVTMQLHNALPQQRAMLQMQQQQIIHAQMQLQQQIQLRRLQQQAMLQQLTENQPSGLHNVEEQQRQQEAEAIANRLAAAAAAAAASSSSSYVPQVSDDANVRASSSSDAPVAEDGATIKGSGEDETSGPPLETTEGGGEGEEQHGEEESPERVAQLRAANEEIVRHITHSASQLQINPQEVQEVILAAEELPLWQQHAKLTEIAQTLMFQLQRMQHMAMIQMQLHGHPYAMMQQQVAQPQQPEEHNEAEAAGEEQQTASLEANEQDNQEEETQQDSGNLPVELDENGGSEMVQDTPATTMDVDEPRDDEPSEDKALEDTDEHEVPTAAVEEEEKDEEPEKQQDNEADSKDQEEEEQEAPVEEKAVASDALPPAVPEREGQANDEDLPYRYSPTQGWTHNRKE